MCSTQLSHPNRPNVARATDNEDEMGKQMRANPQKQLGNSSKIISHEKIEFHTRKSDIHINNFFPPHFKQVDPPSIR